jgi:hypothetical protein
MARIAGIQFKDNAKGLHTHVIIDLKKHGEKLKPFLEEVGVVEEDEFEKKWKKGGYTVEEARKLLIDKIRKHPSWKKK